MNKIEYTKYEYALNPSWLFKIIVEKVAIERGILYTKGQKIRKKHCFKFVGKRVTRALSLCHSIDATSRLSFACGEKHE